MTFKDDDVFVIDAVRTAFGRAGERGIFWKTRAEDMSVAVLQGLMERNPQVSPEMIEDNQAYLATDLWAFGCILFKMLTGVVPFSGTNSFKVFQDILNRDIDFPDIMSKEAIDLVDKLI